MYYGSGIFEKELLRPLERNWNKDSVKFLDTILIQSIWPALVSAWILFTIKIVFKFLYF